MNLHNEFLYKVKPYGVKYSRPNEIVLVSSGALLSDLVQRFFMFFGLCRVAI